MNGCEKQGGYEERTTGVKDWLTGVRKRKSEKRPLRGRFIYSKSSRSSPFLALTFVSRCRMEVQITKVERLNRESTSRRAGNR